VFNKPCPAPFLKKKKGSVNNFFPGESGKLRHINMVYRHISKDMKEHTLWLISHGYAPEDICELLNHPGKQGVVL
jgi:hypothetical protein